MQVTCKEQIYLGLKENVLKVEPKFKDQMEKMKFEKLSGDVPTDLSVKGTIVEAILDSVAIQIAMSD